MAKTNITINKVAVTVGLVILWTGGIIGAHKIGELIGDGCWHISDKIVRRYWK